jgi:hypothetical protein
MILFLIYIGKIIEISGCVPKFGKAQGGVWGVYPKAPGLRHWPPKIWDAPEIIGWNFGGAPIYAD